MITWEEFSKIDIRTGTIVEVKDFAAAKKPAYQLTIDFGPLGIKQSSAQLKQGYKPEDLMGRQILAVVNFPPKQIANFFSECLVLGVYDKNKQVILLATDKPVDNGQPVG